MDEVESKARSELGLKLSMSERRADQLETENHQLKVKLNQKEVELEKTQSARDVNNRKGTDQSISLIGRVPIEILPGKLHIT